MPNGIKAYYTYPFVQLGLGFITFLKIIINNFYFFRANLGSQQNREGTEIFYICPAPTEALPLPSQPHSTFPTFVTVNGCPLNIIMIPSPWFP